LSCVRHQTRTASRVRDSSVNDRHVPRSKTRRDTPHGTHFQVPIVFPSSSHTSLTIETSKASHVALSRSRSNSLPKSSRDISRDLCFESLGIYQSHVHRITPCIVSRVLRSSHDENMVCQAAAAGHEREMDAWSDLAALLQETAAWVRHGGG
jgi:hypothetical protein